MSADPFAQLLEHLDRRSAQPARPWRGRLGLAVALVLLVAAAVVVGVQVGGP